MEVEPYEVLVKDNLIFSGGHSRYSERNRRHNGVGSEQGAGGCGCPFGRGIRGDQRPAVFG